MVRVACISLLVLVGLALASMSAEALVNAGCKATATASKSGTVDLKTAKVWHVTDVD